MARKFLTSIDLNQNQLLNAQIQNLSSAPGSPVEGQIYENTTAHTLQWYNGSAWIDPLNRTNHTGTQLASTISNFDTQVRTSRLDQMAAPTANIAMGGSFAYTITNLATPTANGQAATYDWVRGLSITTFAAPTGNLSMATYRITSLGAPTTGTDATNQTYVLGLALNQFTGTPTANVNMGGTYTISGLPTPTASGQAATYDWVNSQVQSAAAGIASKPPVQCAAVANVSSLSGLQTFDGYTMVANDRVLLTAQSTASQNGPWVVSSGAWTRPTDDGATDELVPGALWLVLNGTTYAASQWRLSAPTSGITPGVTSVTIVQFGAASVYSAGNGLTLSTNTFSVNPASGGGISVSGSGVAVDSTVARKYTATFGDGSTTNYTITHSLGVQNVLVQVHNASTPYAVVDCDVQLTSTSACNLLFNTAPASSSLVVVVIG